MHALLAVARYALAADGASCEFAIVIADAWQGRGFGSLNRWLIARGIGHAVAHAGH